MPIDCPWLQRRLAAYSLTLHFALFLFHCRCILILMLTGDSFSLAVVGDLQYYDVLCRIHRCLLLSLCTWNTITNCSVVRHLASFAWVLKRKLHSWHTLTTVCRPPKLYLCMRANCWFGARFLCDLPSFSVVYCIHVYVIVTDSVTILICILSLAVKCSTNQKCIRFNLCSVNCPVLNYSSPMWCMVVVKYKGATLFPD